MYYIINVYRSSQNLVSSKDWQEFSFHPKILSYLTNTLFSNAKSFLLNVMAIEYLFLLSKDYHVFQWVR